MKITAFEKQITVTLELSGEEANVLFDICSNVAGEAVAYDVCDELSKLGIEGTGRDPDESKLRKGCSFELRFLPKEEE